MQLTHIVFDRVKMPSSMLTHAHLRHLRNLPLRITRFRRYAFSESEGYASRQQLPRQRSRQQTQRTHARCDAPMRTPASCVRTAIATPGKGENGTKKSNISGNIEDRRVN